MPNTVSSAKRLAPALIGMGLVVVATLTPSSQPIPYGSPWCLLCGEIAFADAVQNLLLFVPFGVGLGRLTRSLVGALATSMLLSIAVELLQWHLIPNRDAAAGDVVMNTIGGVAGFILLRHFASLLRPASSIRLRVARLATVTWGVVVAGTAWLLVPLVPEVPHRAEWRPFREDGETYEGELSAVRVDGLDIRDGPVQNWPEVRRLLIRNPSTVEADVTLAAPNSRGVIIARLQGTHMAAAAIVQSGRDLVCERALRATRVRLRSPRAVLPDVFLAQGSSERSSSNYTLQCELRDGSLTARRVGLAGVEQAPLPLTASLGWLLLLPFGGTLMGHLRLINASWMILIAFPVGYLRAFAARGNPLASWAMGALEVAIVLLLALVMAGEFFGLAPLHWTEWASTLSGMIAGALVGGLAGAKNRPSER